MAEKRAFLLHHEDGRIYIAFGKTAVDACLSIDPKSDPDKWAVSGEWLSGEAINMGALWPFFTHRKPEGVTV